MLEKEEVKRIERAGARKGGGSRERKVLTESAGEMEKIAFVREGWVCEFRLVLSFRHQLWICADEGEIYRPLCGKPTRTSNR